MMILEYSLAMLSRNPCKTPLPELYYIPEDGACIDAVGIDAYEKEASGRTKAAACLMIKVAVVRAERNQPNGDADKILDQIRLQEVPHVHL